MMNNDILLVFSEFYFKDIVKPVFLFALHFLNFATIAPLQM